MGILAAENELVAGAVDSMAGVVQVQAQARGMSSLEVVHASVAVLGAAARGTR